MTLPFGHNNGPNGTDQKTGRAEQSGYDKEATSSNFKQGLYKAGCTGRCSEALEQVVENGKHDEAQARRIEEAPEGL